MAIEPQSLPATKNYFTDKATSLQTIPPAFGNIAA